MPGPGTGDGLVILTACDSGYLNFAVRLIRSVEFFSPGQVFMLHVVNPTDEVRARVAALQSALVHTRLLASYESVVLEGWTPEQCRTYYACARFIRLAEIMPACDADFLVLDADALVVNRIDRNFSDKHEAEVCLLRRDLDGADVPDHLAVAAGTFWARNLPHVRVFATEVAGDLTEAMQGEDAQWYLDQRVLGAAIRRPGVRVRVRNIKRRYVDWDFRDDSVIWQAKGERKHFDLRFLILGGLLSDDPITRGRVLRMYRELVASPDAPDPDEPVMRRIRQLGAAAAARVVILLPRLDLPWKREGIGKAGVPRMALDTLELRLHWVRFVSSLANACEQAGQRVEIIQLPAWEIERAYVEQLGAAAVLVPHRCSHDFEPGETPVLFYMQEYFRWMFVADPQGWSASASIYPVPPDVLAPPAADDGTSAGAFDHYRKLLSEGSLTSKFSQPDRRASGTGPRTGRAEPGASIAARLTAVFRSSDRRDPGARTVGERPPKVFFPLQIRHDQAIRYFCDHAFDDVLAAVVAWSEKRGVVLHIKGHPANPKLMREYQQRYPTSPWLQWRDDNLHDLVDECDAVFTVNSGVGFEAMLHGKPIVMFGRAEYDCVAIRAHPHDIDAAWAACQASSPAQLLDAYRRFFDWFTTRYAVDLSQPQASERRLAQLAKQIARLALREPVSAEAGA